MSGYYPYNILAVGEHFYFHTLNKSRLDKMIISRQKVCISFAEASEWVLSKSAYHTNVNYRSAILFCSGDRVESPEEFDEVFKQIINDIEPDHWSQIRPPNDKERKATALLKLTMNEASFKSRTGGPNEDEGDLALLVWNGTLPIDNTKGSCPFHR